MKRALVILLSIMIMVGMVACTTAPTTTGSAGSTTGSETTKDTANSTTGSNAGDEELTVKVLGYDTEQLWDNRENHLVWAEFEKLRETFNLTIEYEVVAEEQYQQIIQTRTSAAMDLPDVASLQGLDLATILNLGNKGVLLDIRALVDANSNGNVNSFSGKYFKPMWNAVTSPNGKAYWIPGSQLITYRGEDFHSNLTAMIRRDWLTKLNLEMPTTLDEFKTVAKAFQEKDANENGQPDEMVLFDPKSFSYIAPTFGLPADIVMVDVYDQKAKSPWLMKDELVAYITYMNGLVNDGVIDTDALDKSDEIKVQKQQNNTISTVFDWALGTWHDAYVAEFEGFYEPTMLGLTEGDIPRTIAEDSYAALVKYGVTNAAKGNEKAVATFFDMLFTEEYAKLCFYGIEGTSHTVNEDGTIVFHPKFKDKDFYSVQSTGDYIWGGMFPALHLSTWESYILSLEIDRPDLRGFSEEYCIGQEYWYLNESFLGVPTDEETAALARIQNDIQTFSEETITKLILGQYNVSDIDQYIATIKTLGLEEYVQIYQNRHDRYVAASNG